MNYKENRITEIQYHIEMLKHNNVSTTDLDDELQILLRGDI